MEIINLLREIYHRLEKATEGKLSTDDKTPERFTWEVFNKIFSILVTCENSLLNKDSLTIHLVARYCYEMLIIFAYVVLDRSKRQERVEKFISFNQFTSSGRSWSEKTLSQLLNSIPNPERFSDHKKYYRALSNLAHPTMDSFLLNRRGLEAEFRMNQNTTVLLIGFLLEIIKICVEEKLYFSDEQIEIINPQELTSRAFALYR